MRKLLYITFLFYGMLAGNIVSAQCDSTSSMCQDHLGTKYISDGQSYKALLVGDEVAEFHTTFFGGSKYRNGSPLIVLHLLKREKLSNLNLLLHGWKN